MARQRRGEAGGGGGVGGALSRSVTQENATRHNMEALV